MKWLLSLIFLFYSLLFPAFAQGASLYKADYKVDYYPQPNESSTSTKIEITIANLSDTSYVDTFDFHVPTSFAPTNISVKDEKGFILPQIVSRDDSTVIKMKFNDPRIGRGSTNTFKLSFDQVNIIRYEGNIVEAILPIARATTTDNYKIQIHVPSNMVKLSLAKPLPTRIQNNVILWDNPQTKVVYAVFGDKQTYRMHLNYHIQNTSKSAKNIEIAIPPDTPNQIVYIDELVPTPQSVRHDEDGNYLAMYRLEPGQKDIIQLGGYVEVSTKPDRTKLDLETKRFDSQKEYLLSSNNYWNLPLKNGPSYTIKDIFESVTSRLSYNYDAIQVGRVRLGAKKAYADPENALCTEYADLFVSLARSARIYSREIEGYGYTQDEKLRPLSNTDILHAWIQTFDPEQEEWRSIDPTWDSTSGIDYLNSFDLNHIVFAIHGRDPVYPRPAGAYKIENTQDVIIEPTSDDPQVRKSYKVVNLDISDKIQNQKTYTGSISIQNTGNTYQYNVPIKLGSQHIQTTLKTSTVKMIAPFETVTIPFKYSVVATIFKPTSGEVKVLVDGIPISKSTFTVFPQTYSITLILGGILLVVLYGIWLLIGRLR